MRTLCLLALLLVSAFSAYAYTPPGPRPLGRYIDPDGSGGFWYVYSDGVHPEFNPLMDDSYQGFDPYDADFVDDGAVNYFYNTYGEAISEGDFTGNGQGFDADDLVSTNVQAPFDAGIWLLLGAGLLASFRFGKRFTRPVSAL